MIVHVNCIKTCHHLTAAHRQSFPSLAPHYSLPLIARSHRSIQSVRVGRWWGEHRAWSCPWGSQWPPATLHSNAPPLHPDAPCPQERYYHSLLVETLQWNTATLLGITAGYITTRLKRDVVCTLTLEMKLNKWCMSLLFIKYSKYIYVYHIFFAVFDILIRQIHFTWCFAGLLLQGTYLVKLGRTVTTRRELISVKHFLSIFLSG